MVRIKEELQKTKKCYLILLKYFLIAATLVCAVGIGVFYQGQSVDAPRYLLIAAVTLACEGIWGFVLFDCLERRLGKS